MERSRIARGVVALMVCCCRLACADIYGYVAADGSIALSNVPTDRHYALLMRDHEDVAAAPAASAAPPRLPLSATQYRPLVERAAQRYGLESALLHAVISVESSYDARAVSKKGALGLMQLMPATAKRYRVADALDPEQNLHGGARYLRDLMGLFDRDLNLVLAAYNAGENAVIRNGNRIPPLKETLNYVPRVLGLYRRYAGAERIAAGAATP